MDKLCAHFFYAYCVCFCIIGHLYVVTAVSTCIQTDNIECSCSIGLINCTGIQENTSDILNLLQNITELHSSNVHTLIFNITGLEFPLDFQIQNLSIETLALGTDLSELPEYLFSPLSSSLKKLFLFGNHLTTILAGPFLPLSNLKNLYLENNNISVLHKTSFSGLNQLETLDLSYNQLKQLELDTFHGLDSLNELEINSNPIDSLSNVNLSLSALTILTIRNSLLTGELESDLLSGLKNLNALNLDRNKLKGIKSFSLSALSNLQSLNLSGNNIKFIEDFAFASVSLLTVLDLSDNGLSVVKTHAFQNLSKLSELYLSGNNLEAMLCEYTTDLVSLEIIDLRHNKIKVLTAGVFAQSSIMEAIMLEGNDLDCSCALLYFASYMNNKSLDYDSATCVSPPKLKNTSLVDVDFKIMKCSIPAPCFSYQSTTAHDNLYETSTLPDIVESTSYTPVETNTQDLSKEILASTTVLTESTSIFLEDVLDETSTHFMMNVSNQLLTFDDNSTEIHTTYKTTAMSTTSDMNTLSTLGAPVRTHLDLTTNNNNHTSIDETTTNIYKIITSVSESDHATNLTNLESTVIPTAGSTGESISSHFHSALRTMETTLKYSAIPTTQSSLQTTQTTEKDIETSTMRTKQSQSNIDEYTFQTAITADEPQATVQIIEYSIVNNRLCVLWRIDGNILLEAICKIRIKSHKGYTTEHLKCPMSNKRSHHCIKISNVYTFCLTVYTAGVITNQACSNQGTSISDILTMTSNSPTRKFATGQSLWLNRNISTTKLDVRKLPISYNITSFEVIFQDSDKTALASWTFSEPQAISVCTLTVIATFDDGNIAEYEYNCTNNSHEIRSKTNKIESVCLKTEHAESRLLTVCKERFVRTLHAGASKSSENGNHNYSLLAVTAVLLVVIALIALLVVKYVRKRTDSNLYNVHQKEIEVNKRGNVHLPAERNVRNSYIHKEYFDCQL